MPCRANQPELGKRNLAAFLPGCVGTGVNRQSVRDCAQPASHRFMPSDPGRLAPGPNRWPAKRLQYRDRYAGRDDMSRVNAADDAGSTPRKRRLACRTNRSKRIASLTCSAIAWGDLPKLSPASISLCPEDDPVKCKKNHYSPQRLELKPVSRGISGSEPSSCSGSFSTSSTSSDCSSRCKSRVEHTAAARSMAAKPRPTR